MAQLKGVFVQVTNSVFVDQEQMEKIFRQRLEELTEGWYIGTNTGIQERRAGQKSHSAVQVLYREGDPQPHNGDTHREEERYLDHPEMQVIRYAVELQWRLQHRRK